MDTIASLLNQRMSENGATEVEVAELLGVSQAQVSRWRNGITVPSESNVTVVAGYLGLDDTTMSEVLLVSKRHKRWAQSRGATKSELQQRLALAQVQLREAEAEISRLMAEREQQINATGHRPSDDRSLLD